MKHGKNAKIGFGIKSAGVDNLYPAHATAAPKLPLEEPQLTAGQIQAKIDALVALGDAGQTTIPANKSELCADYAECKTECLGKPVDDQIECAIDGWQDSLDELE